MKEQIKTYLNRYESFDDGEVDEFYRHLHRQNLEKKQYLLKAGQVCTCRYFIVKGLLRCFYVDDKFNEKISQFAIERWWLTNLESYVEQTPSRIHIQAIEASTVLTLKKKDLEALYRSMPKLERVFRLISEKTLIALQRKTDVFMQASSRQRYQHLLAHIPDFAQRVPQYMIASYLDITPEYLSALRKELNS